MSSTGNNKKELDFEITQSDYQDGLAKGWTDDEMLKPGTYKVKRATRFRKKNTKELKVEIDSDVLEFLSRRSDESYEKQINRALRKVMEDESKAA